MHSFNLSQNYGKIPEHLTFSPWSDKSGFKNKSERYVKFLRDRVSHRQFSDVLYSQGWPWTDNPRIRTAGVCLQACTMTSLSPLDTCWGLYHLQPPTVLHLHKRAHSRKNVDQVVVWPQMYSNPCVSELYVCTTTMAPFCLFSLICWLLFVLPSD